METGGKTGPVKNRDGPVFRRLEGGAGAGTRAERRLGAATQKWYEQASASLRARIPALGQVRFQAIDMLNDVDGPVQPHTRRDSERLISAELVLDLEAFGARMWNGSGSTLVSRNLGIAFAGKVDLSFNPSGVTCRLLAASALSSRGSKHGDDN